ncbi:hypothetical protein [Marinobacterium litorale]|uniref:hypothetical protein n=1 Tax=Marinobacterium litorale TaxID=404770 RepID=UPI0004153F52|nr:hypothetical protein [Marinobacterium litorale]
MNIWALDKDQPIRHLLILLEAQLGTGRFTVDVHSGCDRQAVFIHQPDEPGLRAYLYTLGQAPDRYGVHLEYPAGNAAGNLLEVMENLPLSMLVETLAVHFDIPVIHPLPTR